MLSGNTTRMPATAAVEVIAKHRKLLVVMLTMFMSILFSQAVFAREVRVFYNNSEIRYDVPAQIIDDRTMVPLSQTLEALIGRGTSYDPATRTSTFIANGHTNMHTIGTSIIYVDGQPLYYDYSSVIRGDRALVPLRMITDTTGFKLDWDPVNYFVYVINQNTTTVPTPIVTQAPALPDVQIISFEPSKSTITDGESIIMTVKTTSSATSVWMTDGVNNVDLAYALLDGNGIKTWVVSYSPKATTTLTAYANTSRNTAGAPSRQVTLTVNTTPPVINSATADKTTVGIGENVTVTTKTNISTNFVWVECNNAQLRATLASTDTAAGVKTWTAQVNPNATQTIRVLANTTDTTSNSVTQNVNLTVSTTTCVIYSATPSKSSINQGEEITLTIKTNSATNHVWVDCNGANVTASINSMDTANVKTWIVRVYPNATQELRVYANTTQTTSGAAFSIQHITVTNTAPVTITSATANPQNINSGQSTEITVRTNASATNVWAETGTSVHLLYLSESDIYGNKTWKGTVSPITQSMNIQVYAGKSSNSKEASQSVYVTVQGSSSSTNPEVYSATPNPNKLSQDMTSSTSVTFNVTTNSVVSYIEIVYNNQTHHVSSYSPSGTNKIWTLVLTMKWNGTRNTTGVGYEPIWVNAYTTSGLKSGIYIEMLVQ